MKKKKVAAKKPAIAVKDKTAELLTRAKALLNEIRNREKTYPYVYQANEQKDGKAVANLVNIVRVAELYGHVQTAAKLGYETQLTASDGNLKVVFIKPVPYIPFDLL